MTPQRIEKLRRVLDRRQPDLTVLLDNVHKPHNFSAILRTCDAVGVFEAHAVWPDPNLRPHHMTSGGAGKWVSVRTHEGLKDALADLRSRGLRIIAVHPAHDARSFRDIDYTAPCAVLLGAELEGLSEQSLEEADSCVSIPMQGMGASLNVSVAAAVVLYEAERQRGLAGMYARCRLDPERYRRTLFEWAHPEVAEHCRRRDRPYPPIGEDGEILGPLP